MTTSHADRHELPAPVFGSVRAWTCRVVRFRLFMQDRKLVGISQYYYRGVYSEITEDAPASSGRSSSSLTRNCEDASHSRIQ